MDNAQKAIMIGVGLFITIIIISVVLLITNLGTGVANEGANTIQGVSAGMNQQLALAYDGKTVTANDVVSCATMYGSNTSIEIKVEAATVTGAEGARTAIAGKKSFKGSVKTGEVGGKSVITFTAVTAAT